MSLSIQDIDRWQPESIREVFHAAKKRAQAVADANSGLGTLRTFETWHGKAADAAHGAVGKVRKDLDAHGVELDAVAKAANGAADGVQAIKDELRRIRQAAATLSVIIDPKTGATSLPNPEDASAADIENAASIARRVDAVLNHAESADKQLADLINIASGKDKAPVADDGRGGSAYAKSEKPTKSASANAEAGSGGASASAEASNTSTEYKAGAEWHDKNENFSATIDGKVAAKSEAEAHAKAGTDGVGLGAGAFTGGKAGVEVSEGTDTAAIGAGADVRMGVGGEASAGITKADDEGAYKIEAKLGAAVGIGGGVHLELKVNPEKVLDAMNPFD